MLAPLILLTILVVPFWFATFIYRDFTKSRFYGVLGLSLMLLFAGVGHFIVNKQMTQLLPDFLPFKELQIYLTGILEFIVAIGLLIKDRRKFFGWVAIIMFVVFLPFNIYGAYQEVDFGGHGWGLKYLFLRVPLQLIFIVWAYLFCIKKYKISESEDDILSC